MNNVVNGKRRKNPVLIYVVAAVFLVVGLAIGVLGLSTNKEAIDAATVRAANVNVGKDYYFDELVVIDCYAERTGDGKNEMYYGVMFSDADGKIGVLSLSAKEGQDLYEEMEDYAVSSSTTIGDLVLTGYFEVEKFPDDSTSLVKYYRELEKLYDETLTGYYGATSYHQVNLQYIGETEDAYNKHVSTEKIGMTVFGAAMAVLGLVILLLTLRAQKKAKALAEQHAAQMAAFQATQMQNAPSQYTQTPSQYTNTDPADPKNWQ